MLTGKVYTNNYLGSLDDAITSVDDIVTQVKTQADKDLVNIAHMCSFNAESCTIVSTDLGVKKLTMVMNYLLRHECSTLFPGDVSVLAHIRTEKRYKEVFGQEHVLHRKYETIMADIPPKKRKRIEERIIPQKIRELGSMEHRLIEDSNRYGSKTVVLTPYELASLRSNE